jgi:hypothetical protein
MKCPFCAAELALDERPPPVPAGRVGRAALMAFGTALATASLAGCNKGEEPAIGAEESAPTARPDTDTRSAPAEQENRGRQGSAVRDDAAPIKSPFLVGSEPPPTTPSNNDGLGARPQETARPVIVPTVSTVKPPPTSTWNQKRWNQAKPYGAPPADGMLDVV